MSEGEKYRKNQLEIRDKSAKRIGHAVLDCKSDVSTQIFGIVASNLKIAHSRRDFIRAPSITCRSGIQREREAADRRRASIAQAREDREALRALRAKRRK